MNAQELREVLQISSDKLEILSNSKILSQYNLTVNDISSIIKEFLSAEEISKLFELDTYQNLPLNAKYNIIQQISDDRVKLSLLENAKLTSGFTSYQMGNIIKSLGDEGKKQIIQKVDFLEECGMKSFDILNQLETLTDESKQELLSNKVLIEQKLHLKDYQIKKIIGSFHAETCKLDMISLYELKMSDKIEIFKTFSDSTKIVMLLENEYELDQNQKISLASSLNVDDLVMLFRENKEDLLQVGLIPYKITKSLPPEKQLNFISKLENTGLSLQEKRQILVSLNEKVKSNIDTTTLPPEYVTAIQIQINKDPKDKNAYGKVSIDLNQDLEIYRGLDDLISVNPMSFSDEEKSKFFKLCEICPAMLVQDNIGLGKSTADEYRNAEIWIQSVLQGIKEDWTAIQKVAFIDNAIGKKISYTPDFDTEVSEMSDSRALWKIIQSGYGVCNGIAQVEQYMLDSVGIEAEIASSGRHNFLKLKNISLPNKEGEDIVGDTILDPTWNLAAHRYGAVPNDFCISYDEIRKQDIGDDGTDTKCHQNDSKLASATLGLDMESLREVFQSIGIADREGNFPIKMLMEKSKKIDEQNLPADESIKKQLSLLQEYCPEFATCQNSTSKILQGVLLKQENLEFNKCVVNRVYEKKDSEKVPVLYVYADLPEEGGKFYFADKQMGQFVELSQKEFEEKFECYEKDMEKTGGHRLWEQIEELEYVEDLSRSSGEIRAQEGVDR